MQETLGSFNTLLIIFPQKCSCLPAKVIESKFTDEITDGWVCYTLHPPLATPLDGGEPLTLLLLQVPCQLALEIILCHNSLSSTLSSIVLAIEQCRLNFFPVFLWFFSFLSLLLLQDAPNCSFSLHAQ